LVSAEATLQIYYRVAAGERLRVSVAAPIYRAWLDIHWTARGNAIAAKYVFDYLAARTRDTC
jgi:hypothetical protein